MCIMVVPEREEKWTDNLIEETVSLDFSSMRREMDIKI